eukprot:TRINITY_DN3676_c0_g1_i6.p5 TRINITY_DN3676_c0_g1~~TRINITY_DN3676_c0_g1_i6.p5  ORF type:complete len:124 (-),score=6.28 TRINITY_DN3676_c0_g1_i6:479-850(-)
MVAKQLQNKNFATAKNNCNVHSQNLYCACKQTPSINLFLQLLDNSQFGFVELLKATTISLYQYFQRKFATNFFFGGKVLPLLCKKVSLRRYALFLKYKSYILMFIILKLIKSQDLSNYFTKRF